MPDLQGKQFEAQTVLISHCSANSLTSCFTVEFWLSLGKTPTKINPCQHKQLINPVKGTWVLVWESLSLEPWSRAGHGVPGMSGIGTLGSGGGWMLAGFPLVVGENFPCIWAGWENSAEIERNEKWEGKTVMYPEKNNKIFKYKIHSYWLFNTAI